MRETYAATLDDTSAPAYRAAFDRAASSRLRGFTGLLGGGYDGDADE